MILAMKNQPPSVDSLVQAVSMVHAQCCLLQCTKFLCSISFRFNCASDECFQFHSKASNFNECLDSGSIDL